MTIHVSETTASPALRVVLARYGSIPQVARFELPDGLPSVSRNTELIATTDRGEELVHVLEAVRPMGETTDAGVTGKVLRSANSDDLQLSGTRKRAADLDFVDWQQRVDNWGLQLQIIDLEYTLDEQIILYVLNQQNAETTRMALLAAAAGLGVVHVQPVSSEGIIATGGGGGGCGSGGCGCSH